MALHPVSTPASIPVHHEPRTKLGPIPKGDTEEARRRGLNGVQAKRAKAQRSEQDIARSALRSLLLKLEGGGIDVDGRSVGGVIRALHEVAQGGKGTPDTGALATEILSKLRELNSKGGKGLKPPPGTAS